LEREGDNLSLEYSIEERSKKYDELYARASEILNKFDPCKIANGTCAQGRDEGCNFCCDGCPSLSKKGCTVQSLYCRTWVCESAARAMGEKYILFNELMTQIDDEAREYGLYIFRAGKLECLGLNHLSAARVGNKEFTGGM
jgi:hypothetical protein